MSQPLEYENATSVARRRSCLLNVALLLLASLLCMPLVILWPTIEYLERHLGWGPVSVLSGFALSVGVNVFLLILLVVHSAIARQNGERIAYWLVWVGYVINLLWIVWYVLILLLYVARRY